MNSLMYYQDKWRIAEMTERQEYFEPNILVPYVFSKTTDNSNLNVRLIRFDDESVCLDGDEEIIFEFGEIPSWKRAMEFLKESGYVLYKKETKLSIEEAIKI